MATHMVYKYSVYVCSRDGSVFGSPIHTKMAQSGHAVADEFFKNRHPELRHETIAVKDMQMGNHVFYKWFEPEVPAGQKTVVITCEVR